MKKLGVLLGAAGVAWALSERGESKKQEEDERRRKNMPCCFNEGISHWEFNAIAESACKEIKRVQNVEIDGATIHGTVRSQSRLSSWTFSIDFNDYGHITGKYWISSENDDSEIPHYVAKAVEKEIRSRLSQCHNDGYDAMYQEQSETENARFKDCAGKGKSADEQENEKRQYATVHELDATQKKKRGPNHETTAMLCLVLMMAFCFGGLFYLGYREKQEHALNQEYQVSLSPEDIENLQFSEAKEILSNDGFCRIELIPHEDLIFGIFDKEGAVESITINGSDEFEKGDWFSKDALIKITYHRFRE